MLVRTQQTLVALAILQSYRFSRCHACRNDYDLMQSLQRSIRSAPGRLDAFGAAFEATGLVVACVAGGHILLATAGVAGFGLNAAQQYMTDSLGKLKKTYGRYRCYTWCYRCQVSTSSHAVNQEPDAECNREGDLAQILWRASKILSTHQTQQI